MTTQLNISFLISSLTLEKKISLCPNAHKPQIQVENTAWEILPSDRLWSCCCMPVFNQIISGSHKWSTFLNPFYCYYKFIPLFLEKEEHQREEKSAFGREKKRETDTDLQSLVHHSKKPANIQVWSKPMPGSRKDMVNFHMGDSCLSTWTILYCLAWHLHRETGQGAKQLASTWTIAPKGDASIANSSLTHCTTTSASQNCILGLSTVA